MLTDRFVLFFKEKDAIKKEILLPDGGGYFQSKSFSLKVDSSNVHIQSTLRNISGRDLEIDRIEAFLGSDRPSVELPSRLEWKIFQHGYQSWSLSTLRTHQEADEFARLRWKHDIDENPETPASTPFPLGFFPKKGLFYSEGCVGFEAEHLGRKFHCLWSTGSSGEQFVRFRVVLGRKGLLKDLTAVWDFNGATLVAHARQPLTTVNVYTNTSMGFPSFGEFLNASAKKLSHHLHAGKRLQDPVIGWCSWYHYYNRIDEKIILENLQELEVKKLAIDVFQIDDGYQSEIGDWLKVNKRFPRGLEFLAKEIRKKKMTAGLWLAPFLARPQSDIVKNVPALVLKDENEKPVMGLYNPLWGGQTWTLDVTHPAFEEFITDTIKTLVSWGFDYLKLDFLYAACYRGKSYDKTITGATKYKRAIQMIRRAAGNKTFLLGCGAPLFPSIGAFNAMRIGMDVNSKWEAPFLGKLLRDRNFPSLQGALVNAINRSFMHLNFFRNDPDCLMVRKTETHLSEAQIQIMASIMALTGGMILISDDMKLIDDDRLQIIKKTLKLHEACAHKTAIPVDMMDHHFPRVLYNPAGYLGIWNPTAFPHRLQFRVPSGVDAGDLQRTKDFWSNKRIPFAVNGDSAEVSLGPWESMVARL